MIILIVMYIVDTNFDWKEIFLCLKFLWNEVCDEILTPTNEQFVTPKLITKLMYAFRDIQVRIGIVY